MQKSEKTYSALRYAAVIILLFGIGFIYSTLSAHPMVEDNTGKEFAEETASHSGLGTNCLSDVVTVQDNFQSTSHGADRSPFSSLHFFMPEIDELDKLDLSLTVGAHRSAWKIRPSALCCHASLIVSSFDITDKILSLLETVVLLN